MFRLALDEVLETGSLPSGLLCLNSVLCTFRELCISQISYKNFARIK